jgi:fucose permease
VTGSYWATFTIGRIIAGLFAKRVGVDAMVQGSLLGAILGALVLWWNPAAAANLVSVALIGFAIAPVFPALMSGTSQRVGASHAANTIGLQMVSTGLGGATISTLLGVLARRTSLEVIPICLLGLFLLLFGMYRLAMRIS